ncbi:MAG: transcription elongation factor GreA [Nitriliruptorales bacterium]
MSETWLSQEAHDRLRAELEELRTRGRARIAATIEEARSHGDLRENAEYDAAKDEQGKMEARIRQIEALLREAKVGQQPRSDVVAPGVVVTLVIDEEKETYFVAGSREERHEKFDVISIASPVGRAVLGARKGDTVQVEAPSGAFQVTVAEIRAGEGSP